MKRSLSLLSSKASSITNKYNCSVFDDMGENDMRFIDVLRQQPQSVNILSEEGFYILPTYVALYSDEDTKLPKLCET